MKTRGSSLIELILYTGLLITILSVLYQLFAVAGIRKVSEIVEDEIYTNANHIVADFSRTIPNATVVTSPIIGDSSSTLSLNNGAIVYQLDGNNRLVKTENGVTEQLVTDKVSFTSLTFTQLGPSTNSPTVTVSFTIRGERVIEGQIRSRAFQTGYTLR